MRTLLCMLCLSLPTLVTAQTTAATDGPVVVTHGQAVVKRAPDRAWVTIAAESRARTPGEAQKLNADAMSAVMGKLKAAALPADAIRTVGLDLQPEFDYANNRQTLRGYLARNAVEVRVDDLPRLGSILEGSVSAGATNVSGVRFDVKDRDGAEREALRLAVADARARADAAVAGAGVKVERILRIEEERTMPIAPQPRIAMMQQEGMRVMSGEPPVAPGEIEIRSNVTLTAVIR
ncbi:MAG: SIMPL domain-containing protein [Vicinamibacterales bacterium]